MGVVQGVFGRERRGYGEYILLEGRGKKSKQGILECPQLMARSNIIPPILPSSAIKEEAPIFTRSK